MIGGEVRTSRHVLFEGADRAHIGAESVRQGRDDSEWPEIKYQLGCDQAFQRVNTDETGTPARGHVPKFETHLAAGGTLRPVGGTVTTMIRTAHVDLTEMIEIDLPEAWTITLPHGTGMMIHDDGGTMESEMRG